jgi:16S rRNA (uracil1498-N3)-methyltransferase
MRVPVTLAGRYNEIAETFHRRCFCEHRNRMIWVFVPPGSIREGILTIDGAKGRHLARVRRVRPGELGVAVADGRQHAFEVLAVDGSAVRGRVLESRPIETELGHHLILLQALLPSADFDAVIEGTTEAGVTRIVPVRATRSVARPAVDRQPRWQAVAEAAAEQSHRGRIPDVTRPMLLSEALHDVAGTALVILDPAAGHPLQRATGNVALAVGPEGGWTAEEVAAMVAAGGTAASLGPRIFRARLAPVAAAVILSSAT